MIDLRSGNERRKKQVANYSMTSSMPGGVTLDVANIDRRITQRRVLVVSGKR